MFTPTSKFYLCLFPMALCLGGIQYNVDKLEKEESPIKKKKLFNRISSMMFCVSIAALGLCFLADRVKEIK